jgi:predicted dehydrogenase
LVTKIKTVFIGAGYMAREHVKAFSDIATVELVGIYSRTRTAAEQIAAQFKISAVYNSVQEMYAACCPEIIIVAVSELAVEEVCDFIFQHPGIVLVEKPIGYKFEVASRIQRKIRHPDCHVFVALNRRHYSSTRAVKDDLANDLSDRRLVQVFDQESPDVGAQSGKPPEVVKNWMYANSIHLIDYFFNFCRGAVVQVDPIIQWNAMDPEWVFSKILFSSGDVGIYQAVWNRPGPWSVSITTQAKRWELRPLECGMWQANGSRNATLFPEHTYDKLFKPGLRMQAEELVRVYKGESFCLPTIDDGLTTMQLVRMIYAA